MINNGEIKNRHQMKLLGSITQLLISLLKEQWVGGDFGGNGVGK